MKQYKFLLDGISVPAMILNSDLQLVLSNSAAYNNLSEIEIGSVPATLCLANREIIISLNETLASRGTMEFTIVTSETFQREFFVSVKTISDPEHAPEPALLLTFVDQTPLRVAKSMRSDFVANVSHEIRSPLTAISGFVETLQGDAQNDPEARKLFLRMMEKEVTRMTNLVSDLLSLSKVEAKENRAPKNPANLEQVIRQSVESVTTLARKRGKQLEYKIDPNLPDVMGKPDHLSRALINLMENAINYGRDNSTVSLRAEPAPKTNPLGVDAVMVAVQDEGEGIPAKEIPRLTERFYRVDKSRSRNVGGTGLGLAIVKHILVRHRGVLNIESTLGKGSTFSAFLPVGRTTEETLKLSSNCYVVVAILLCAARILAPFHPEP